MRDYEEKSYYEIQLDNKQLILVFLAGVTVCVLIFVLGVMVGKGKKEAEMAAVGSRPTTATQPAAVQQEEGKSPGNMKPMVDEQAPAGTPEGKEGTRVKTAAASPQQAGNNKEQYSFYDLDKTKTEPASARPVAAAAKQQQQQPQQQPDATKKPEPQATSPAAAPDTKTTTTTPAAAANGSNNIEVPGAGRYTIQVMATSNKKKADEQLAALKKKGYSARLDETTDGGRVSYKVRVGTFPDPESAKKVAARLKEQMKLDTWVFPLK